MRYRQEQMETIISAWRQSGLSKKEFCRAHNIANATFHYWYKRLTSTPSAVGFTALEVEAGTPSHFEVIFSSGTRLVFQVEPSVNWLRELVG